MSFMLRQYEVDRQRQTSDNMERLLLVDATPSKLITHYPGACVAHVFETPLVRLLYQCLRQHYDEAAKCCLRSSGFSHFQDVPGHLPISPVFM